MKKSVALGTVPVVTSMGASSSNEGEDFDEDIKKAFAIETAHGTEAMVEYMREKGYHAANNSVTFNMELGESDPSTEKIEDPQGEGIKGNMTGFYDTYENIYHISMGIQYNFKADISKNFWTGYCEVTPDSYGTEPMDAAGLAWNVPNADPWWEVAGNNALSDFAYTYGEHTDWEDGTYVPNTGLGYTFNDEEVYWDWIEDNFQDENDICQNMGYHDEYVYGGRCGVKLESVGNHASSERAVYGSYTHAWESTTTNVGLNLGVSAGTGGAGIGVGVTLTPESKVDQKTTQTKKDGDTLLRITQEEILDQGPCC